MSKMDLLDKLRMRLWLENRRLYGSGGEHGESVSQYHLSDIQRIKMKGDVIAPEHYERKIVRNNAERKEAFRDLLKKHGVEIPSNVDPDLFTYFLSVLRARAPYTLEGSRKVLDKRRDARAKRAAKRRAARERERNRGNAANGNANERDEDNEEEGENAAQEVQPPPARAAPVRQKRKNSRRAATRTRADYNLR